MNTAETLPDDGTSRVCLTRGDTALVLCGGGGHGALEVGFVRALSDLGIGYDQILGTSIGAVNGAFLAGGMSADDLADLWRAVRLRQLLRPNWSWVLHPRSRPGLLSLGAFGRFLERTLPSHRFEDLRVPLTIVTTDLIPARRATGKDQAISSRRFSPRSVFPASSRRWNSTGIRISMGASPKTRLLPAWPRSEYAARR